MAYTREAFINTIEEHISCALLEFYKAKLAAKNRQTRKTAGRIARIRDLLERNLVVTLWHDVRGFTNRRRAINGAVAEMKAVDETFRRGAERMVSTSIKPRKLRTSVPMTIPQSSGSCSIPHWMSRSRWLIRDDFICLVDEQ
jgi:hypothetical protein